jgi:hypothetical protein
MLSQERAVRTKLDIYVLFITITYQYHLINKSQKQIHEFDVDYFYMLKY